MATLSLPASENADISGQALDRAADLAVDVREHSQALHPVAGDARTDDGAVAKLVGGADVEAVRERVADESHRNRIDRIELVRPRRAAFEHQSVALSGADHSGHSAAGDGTTRRDRPIRHDQAERARALLRQMIEIQPAVLETDLRLDAESTLHADGVSVLDLRRHIAAA